MIRNSKKSPESQQDRRSRPSASTPSPSPENEFGPEISNSALCEEDLPANEAQLKDRWGKFALTFDASTHWGSTAKCAEVANQAATQFRQTGGLPESLTGLRTCLFFEQRRWHRYGTEIDQQSMA